MAIPRPSQTPAQVELSINKLSATFEQFELLAGFRAYYMGCKSATLGLFKPFNSPGSPAFRISLKF